MALKLNETLEIDGYIHETNTVYHAVPSAVTLLGTPCLRFSWFPGYAWQIAVCSQCNGHLGWKFMANPTAGTNLVPKSFYGLSGGRILIRRYVKKRSEEDDESSEPVTAHDSENEHVDTEDDDDDDDDDVDLEGDEANYNSDLHMLAQLLG